MSVMAFPSVHHAIPRGFCFSPWLRDIMAHTQLMIHVCTTNPADPAGTLVLICRGNLWPRVWGNLAVCSKLLCYLSHAVKSSFKSSALLSCSLHATQNCNGRPGCRARARTCHPTRHDMRHVRIRMHDEFFIAFRKCSLLYMCGILPQQGGLTWTIGVTSGRVIKFISEHSSKTSRTPTLTYLHITSLEVTWATIPTHSLRSFCTIFKLFVASSASLSE